MLALRKGSLVQIASDDLKNHKYSTDLYTRFQIPKTNQIIDGVWRLQAIYLGPWTLKGMIILSKASEALKTL